jgi:hypothetical protein
VSVPLTFAEGRADARRAHATYDREIGLTLERHHIALTPA